MIPPSLSLVLVCVLNIWTINAASCGDRQTEVNGRCCDLCPPGKYVKEFCSEDKQTVCSPCEEGSYSNEYNSFGKCHLCQSCQQEYDEKCTPTTNANCSCRVGFLCSNNVCSHCVENKCVTGEKLKRTDTASRRGLIQYSYQCEALCPDDEYFDVKEDACKKRIQCSIFGLPERFPGNKTHNAVCNVTLWTPPDDVSSEWNGTGGDFVHVMLGTGFVLLSLTLLVLLSHTCIKNLMKRKPYDNPINPVAVPTNASNFHLSKEESGLQLILQDESKDSMSDSLDLEKVSVI